MNARSLMHSTLARGGAALVLAAVAVLVPLVTTTVVAQPERDTAAPVREAPRVLDARTLGVGRLVPDFAYTDIDGKPGRLSDHRGRAVVVLSRGVTCPLSKKYGPSVARLAKEWGAKQDVDFIVLGVAEQDSLDDLRADRERTGIAARWVHDPEGQLRATLGVRSTTEVFVIDGARTLVFRGAIDDRFGLGYARDEARETYVVDALTATLARHRPVVEATSAPGCAIESGAAPDAKSTSGVAPTYHADVARILDRNCVECHRESGSAPFGLTSYKLAKGNRAMIRLMVERRLMPPWFANAEHSLAMGNDRSLSGTDRATLLAWVDAKCPLGDEADAPLPEARAKGWVIGEPDAVLQTTAAVEVPAEGVLPYQYDIVETEFPEDRWIAAFEVRPTSPQVVHHILVFAHYPAGHPRAADQPQARNGLGGYFAAMVPGQNFLVFPEGTGRFLPKGTRLRFQVHYTPNGSATTDRPELGLIFTDGPPKAEVASQGIFNARFRIPPGAKEFPVTGKYRFDKPGRVLSFTPHMHLRGAAFRYEMKLPDGEWTTILDVPRYDFNWQLNYRLREPLDVPAGTMFRATGTFDNSDGNPANPDPKKTVRFGEQTSDEMMIGYFEWIPAGD